MIYQQQTSKTFVCTRRGAYTGGGGGGVWGAIRTFFLKKQKTGGSTATDLCQVEVCVLEEVRVVLLDQPHHVVKLPMLLVHGDGHVRLFHGHVKPVKQKEE